MTTLHSIITDFVAEVSKLLAVAGSESRLVVFKLVAEMLSKL